MPTCPAHGDRPALSCSFNDYRLHGHSRSNPLVEAIDKVVRTNRFDEYAHWNTSAHWRAPPPHLVDEIYPQTIPSAPNQSGVAR